MVIINKIKSFYTKYKGWVIGVGIALIVGLILWFVFRKVKTDWNKERNAERELLIEQRIAKEKENDSIRREAVRKEDSLIMEMLGIKSRVEYKIKWRTEYVNHYIDTATVRTKFFYIDSLLGPK